MTDSSLVLLLILFKVGIRLVTLSVTDIGAVLVLAEMVMELALAEVVNTGFYLEIAVPGPAFIIVLRALSSCGVSGRIVPITIDCEVEVFSAIRRGTSQVDILAKFPLPTYIR